MSEQINGGKIWKPNKFKPYYKKTLLGVGSIGTVLFTTGLIFTIDTLTNIDFPPLFYK